MSLINNRNEESLPEFEVISGGKEDIRSSFADRTEEETEIDLIDLAWALLDKIHYIVLCFLIGAVIMSAYSYFLVLMGNTFVCYVAGEKNAFNHRWGHPSNPWGY